MKEEKDVNKIEEQETGETNKFDFKKYAWGQFKKNKPAYISLYILGILVIMAIFAPIIANERPLYMKYKGETFWPAFTFKKNYEIKDPATGKTEKLQLDIAEWKKMEFESVVWAPITWSPGKMDPDNRDYIAPGGEQKFTDGKGVSMEMPGRFRHLLGTNSSGEDMLSGLIHGTRISLSIGLISMGIASVIGLLLGSLAGYFGDVRLQTTRARQWMIIFSLPVAWFYGFNLRSFALKDAIADSGFQFLLQFLLSLFIFAFVIVVFSYLGKLISRGKFLGKVVYVPVDSYISRGIEILNSIPTLILILSLAAIAKEPSIVYVMVIIGLTSWTGIARFTRAELLKIRNLEYIQAARAMGFGERRIIFRHALRNGLAPSLVSIAFGVAAAVIAESSLSFLGVGVPPDTITWGKLLFQGKEHFQAWWLVLFPGFAIFLTVTVYNLIGEGLRDALDPKLKQ